MTPKSPVSRAPLSEDLTELRGRLSALIPILEQKPDWYGSVFYERKASKGFLANLKQSQLSDQISAGIVLRIYDGYTLYEQASDQVDPESLKTIATEFAKKVQNSAPFEGAVKRAYHGAKWSERLSPGLDEEITSQIPNNVQADTFVHFGIRYSEDPSSIPGNSCLEQLKGIVSRCKELTPKVGLNPDDLTFVMTRQNFSYEESIFVDRETNMSQALYRLSLMIITMSGADRTFCRMGGLGGLETVRITDDEIVDMLRNLKALKKAERLPPGKYRVLFGPVLTGVLAHEAFGHSQEGDTCARGRSKAWELHKSGEVVGNEHATILNNPAIFRNAEHDYAAWGSYFFDEEGWLSQKQVLLDKGILKPPMTNLTSALRLGVARTANGKRESWANGVYTRQTNTYFSAGNKTLDELMTELKDGFLALHPAGGMEDPKGMGIQVGISFLQEIRDGKPTGRLFKGPAGGDIQMTGYTPDILNSIVAKSKIEFNSKEPDKAQNPFNDTGGCGKYHKEFVYAGCGGPYLLLDNVILG